MKKALLFRKFQTQRAEHETPKIVGVAPNALAPALIALVLSILLFGYILWSALPH